MEFEYEKLLENAQAKIPEALHTQERFEIPKVKGHIQGSKTIIINFSQIVETLNRDPQHLLKYLLRELATPGQIDGPRLILGRKIGSSLINTKIEKYTTDFVLCPDCKKPDTKLQKEARITTIKCAACGAKHTIKAKI